MDGHFRDYIRTSFGTVDAKISDNQKKWFSVQVPNISASGLLFLTDREYRLGDMVFLKLHIIPMVISPAITIDMKVKAEVVNYRGTRDNLNVYAVKFTEVAKEDQIRLDELICLAIAKYGEEYGQ